MRTRRKEASSTIHRRLTNYHVTAVLAARSFRFGGVRPARQFVDEHLRDLVEPAAREYCD
jgi:Arc/MetJ family transcription regulator